MSRVVMNFAVIFIISCQVTSVFLAEVELKEGETFIKLSNFIRAIVLKPTLKIEYCRPWSIPPTSAGIETYNEACHGTVTNCIQLNSTWCSNTLKLYSQDGHLVTVDDNNTIYGEPVFNGRQPNKIEFEHKCTNDNQIMLTSYNGETYLKTCHFYMCDCVEDKKNSTAIRSFSLLPEISNIADNMVVTGLNFKLVGKTIHIMIAQKKLREGYLVERNNGSSWKTPESIKDATNDLMHLDSNLRTVYLDEIILPNDRVVTGVRFKNYGNSEKGALGIEIQGTIINKNTSILDQNNSRWFNSNYMVAKELKSYGSNKKRTPIPLEDLLDSWLAPENREISETNKLIEFTTTSKKRTLGKSTIPYFLMNSYEGHVALAGVRLTYKNAEGFGGFIALDAIPSSSPTRSVGGLLTYIIMSVVLLKWIITY